MTDTATATETKSTTPETIDSKVLIYLAIAEYVFAKTGKKIGKTGGQELFNIVVERTFEAATKDKSFRFNGGYGSLHVKQYAAGSRNLPSGQKTTFGERSKLRYEQGVTTTLLIEGKEVKFTPIPAPAPEPVKAAKATPATPAAAAPAPAATEGAMNLE